MREIKISRFRRFRKHPGNQISQTCFKLEYVGKQEVVAALLAAGRVDPAGFVKWRQGLEVNPWIVDLSWIVAKSFNFQTAGEK